MLTRVSGTGGEWKDWLAANALERPQLGVALARRAPAPLTTARGVWSAAGMSAPVVVVNNAAVAPPRPALDDAVKRWRLAVDVNLNGPFYLMYHLCPRMAAGGGGRVVNVSSGAAVTPSFGRPSYTATKRALEGLTQALAHELAGRVAVNCIRIDMAIWTEGFDATLPADFDTSWFEDAVIMSDAVLWLSQQDLAFTGQILTLGELRARGIVRPPTRTGRA